MENKEEERYKGGDSGGVRGSEVEGQVCNLI
jgi:hypothetical protein